jgi:imidazolonepropionase
MIILNHIRQLMTLRQAFKKSGRHLSEEDLDIIENAYLVLEKGKILDLGPAEKCDPKLLNNAKQVINGDKLVVMPGITDCHTHTVFAGNRAHEFKLRLAGATYQEIAAAGGGIRFTTQQTRTASLAELIESGKERLNRMARYGVKNIEIKSGYGLSIEHEIKISKAISALREYFRGRLNIFNTFMGAHAIGAEFQNSHEYMKNVVLPTLNTLKTSEKIDFVDIFHEQGYFNDADLTQLFSSASELGIKIKIHADELNDNNGAGLAVDHHAVSADHLMAISKNNIKKIANSETTAVMLPGTSLFLGKKMAPARELLDAGARLAIASDYNPGSCHFDNVLLLASMTAPTMKMKLHEVIAAITLNASYACAQPNLGYIDIGNPASLSLYECQRYEEIFYGWGINYCVNHQFDLSQS